MTLLFPISVIYFIGAGLWLILSLIEWDVERRYPDRNDPDGVSRAAKRVLLTPLWPLETVGMLGRTIGALVRDVMR